MKILILSIFLNSSIVYAVEKNHCVPRPETKKYIDFDFSSPYPKTAIFSCDYECSTGEISKVIKATRTVSLLNEASEGVNLVCKGVKVKRTNWGHDFDGIKPFFVYDTQMLKIRDWATSENIELDSFGSEKLMNKLITTFASVSASYAIAGLSNTTYSPEFQRASEVLQEIVNQLPSNTSLLDGYIDLIEKNNGNVTSSSYSESLVLAQISIFAKWRISPKSP